jgi:hypothetical protein
MKTTLKAATAVLALVGLGMSANTMAAEGLYVGGSAIQSRFDSDNFDIDDVDDEDTGWKAFVGIRPVPYFGAELAYTKFGEAQAPSFAAEAEAWSAFGLGIVPVGPVELFVKAGAARIKTDSTSILFENKETEFAYGAGVQLAFGRLGLRAEYEKFDTDVIGDLDVISLGVTLTFGAGS